MKEGSGAHRTTFFFISKANLVLKEYESILATQKVRNTSSLIQGLREITYILLMRKGQFVRLYANWQSRSGSFEEGELVEKISDGLPFILSENGPTYAYETWKVKTTSAIRVAKIAYKIRRPPVERVELEPIPNLKDSFIKVNGKEIY